MRFYNASLQIAPIRRAMPLFNLTLTRCVKALLERAKALGILAG